MEEKSPAKTLGLFPALTLSKSFSFLNHFKKDEYPRSLPLDYQIRIADIGLAFGRTWKIKRKNLHGNTKTGQERLRIDTELLFASISFYLLWLCPLNMGGLSLMLHPRTGWGITFDGMAILNNFFRRSARFLCASTVPLFLSVTPLPYWDRGAREVGGLPVFRS